jgi:hypothetical protein
MTRLLTFKHWQIFLLLIGLPMIFQFIAMGYIMTSSNPNVFIIAFPTMMILSVVLFFGWFYTLGTKLHKKLPETSTMNLTRFKIFLFIPVIYMLSISVFMFGVFSFISTGEQPTPAILVVILLLHLFSMFCIFYCLHFIAKALKTVEWQKPVTFSDFAGEFFLIWFFPIGIWIIQPRLNRIFDDTIDVDNNQILDHNV